MKIFRFGTVACLLSALLLSSCDSGSSIPGTDFPAPDPGVPGEPPPTDEQTKPNILFIVMDDVGVDQMPSMGYGGAEAPTMPSIDTIAGAGIRFRNVWSMPECSPGRSALMTGRYPLRNHVYQALGPNDLANSQIDPWEMTVAKVLEGAGYENGMFGKFHLAGPEHNQAGTAAPSLLGWDHFYGWTGGLPGSIDTTAGGIAPEGTYSCGFVPDMGAHNGAYSGACYVPQSNGTSCSVIAGTNEFGDSAGLQCLADGGILVPNTACEAIPPDGLAFNKENAHYVSPLVVNANGQVEEASLLDNRGRGYRSTIEVDAAIDWINNRPENTPWMATVSFSAPHTPLQRPPGNLLGSNIADHLTADCEAPLNQRRLSDAMIEAMDTEIGRLLVATGIAEAGGDGNLIYDPTASDTLVVIVGDNGSFGPTVKLPFDPFKAKGTAYQTGIWVPLIVSGPQVQQPDRDVEHMVNAVDVFALFAEVAEVDIEQAVPRRIDAVTMTPYLESPLQDTVRNFNFAQGGLNHQANNAVNGPCVFNGSSCSHTPVSKTVCEDNGGTWWGQGADDPDVLAPDLDQCWQVNQAIYHSDSDNYAANRIDMAPTIYQTLRDQDYKLVRNWALDYDPVSDSGKGVSTEEFYRINQAAPVPQLDTDNLLERPLTALEQQHYTTLTTEFDRLLSSETDCPGDGNGDGAVDQLDIDNYTDIQQSWGLSSRYDFNLDGLTNELDLQIINENLGVCSMEGQL